MIFLVEKELGEKAEIDFQPMQPEDVPESFADIDKSIEKLSFNPQICINEGIPQLIEWYKVYFD